MVVSFPKNKINVLLLEGVHADAVEAFKKEGYNVEYSPDSLTENELVEKLKVFMLLEFVLKQKLRAELLKRLISF